MTGTGLHENTSKRLLRGGFDAEIHYPSFRPCLRNLTDPTCKGKKGRKNVCLQHASRVYSAAESKLAWPVGGHNHLDLSQVLEPVQLVQQFHQRALDLPAA